MKTITFESPLMVCTKQKVTETETEEENVIEEECGPEDLFVWSSAWSETETETKDGDWKLQRGSTDSTGEDETEKDIRWVLFVTTFFALLYS